MPPAPSAFFCGFIIFLNISFFDKIWTCIFFRKGLIKICIWRDTALFTDNKMKNYFIYAICSLHIFCGLIIFRKNWTCSFFIRKLSFPIDFTRVPPLNNRILPWLVILVVFVLGTQISIQIWCYSSVFLRRYFKKLEIDKKNGKLK